MTKKLPQNTIPKFLLQVIKPYKWWYLLMMQAPIVNSFYKVFSMLAVAKVVDVLQRRKFRNIQIFFIQSSQSRMTGFAIPFSRLCPV